MHASAAAVGAAFLVTTDRFLQVMGLGSLAELPPREAVPT